MSPENPRPFGPENRKTNDNADAGTNPTDQPGHIKNPPFDKTSIHEALSDEKVAASIDTGELHQVAAGEYWSARPPAQELPTDKDKKSRKGIIIGGIATAVGLSVIGGTIGFNAMAKNNEAETPTQPTAEAPIDPSVYTEPTEVVAEPTAPSPTDIPLESFTPTPTPVESAEPTAIETEKGGEYTAAELREMPLDNYLALGTKEREPLTRDALNFAIEWQEGEFGAHWDGNTSELYKFNPLEIASKDNTAEEIAMQHLYWTQLALTQTEDMESSRTFDPDMATKVLAGGFTRSSYISNGGNESLVNGNEIVSYWSSAFKDLDPTEPKGYAQKVIGAEFTNQSTITDSTTGTKHTIVTIEFATEPLPETLVDGFKKDTAVFNRLSFVWNEDVGQWLNYAGVPQNQQPGWKPAK